MTQSRKAVNKTWATQVLREDHDRIEDLIADFDDPAEKERRAEILDMALAEIRVHRALVEEVLLPAVREASGDPAALSEVQDELDGWEPLLEGVERLKVNDPRFAKAWQTLKAEFERHLKRGHKGLQNLAKTLRLDDVKMGLRMAELRRQIMAERPTLSEDTAN